MNSWKFRAVRPWSAAFFPSLAVIKGLIPAVKTKAAELITNGKGLPFHFVAKENAMKRDIKESDIIEEGFIGRKGEFLSREAAFQQITEEGLDLSLEHATGAAQHGKLESIEMFDALQRLKKR